MQRKCEDEYLSNLQVLSKTQMKPFWAYAKSLRNPNVMPQRMTWNGNEFKGATAICEAFVSYFDSVHEAPKDLPAF